MVLSIEEKFCNNTNVMCIQDFHYFSSMVWVVPSANGVSATSALIAMARCCYPHSNLTTTTCEVFTTLLLACAHARA